MKNQPRFVHGKILLLFVPWGNLVPLLRPLARVVQQNNNAISVHGSITIQWVTQLVSLILIHWIVIYPVESAIQRLKNWNLERGEWEEQPAWELISGVLLVSLSI